MSLLGGGLDLVKYLLRVPVGEPVMAGAVVWKARKLSQVTVTFSPIGGAHIFNPMAALTFFTRLRRSHFSFDAGADIFHLMAALTIFDRCDGGAQIFHLMAALTFFN